MSRIGQLLFLLVILGITSCKKEANFDSGNDAEEALYKQKLTNLLHYDPEKADSLMKSLSPDAVSNNIRLNFKTNKEAYEFFRFLEIGKFQTVDTFKMIPNASTNGRKEVLDEQPSDPNGSVTDPDGNGGATYNYETVVQVLRTITKTFGTGTLAFQYQLDMALYYPGINQSAPEILKNQTSNVAISYTGIGTVVAAGGSPNTFVVPNGANTNTGTISGLMQGTATVLGTPTSFIITMIGNYSFTTPLYQLTIPIITTTLTVTSP
jgi:hypothetical protein